MTYPGVEVAPTTATKVRSDRLKAGLWLGSLGAYAGVCLLTIAGTLASSGGVASMLWAIPWAFAAVQLGYLGHDLQHGQVPLLATWRKVLGWICWNLLLGVSLSWWRDKHGRHHRHSHVDRLDPDLHPLFATDVDAGRALPRIHRWFVSWQNWLFWPVTAFARVYYQMGSLRSVLRFQRRDDALELVLLLAHHGLVIGGVLAMLGVSGLPFLVAGELLSGLAMGFVFATNHLGMPLASTSQPGRWWQVPHTRNIRTGRLGDYLLGGLNLQIEHHLYPHLDREGLRRIQPWVEDRCARDGIEYRRTSLVAALREVQSWLRATARGVRQA